MTISLGGLLILLFITFILGMLAAFLLVINALARFRSK